MLRRSVTAVVVGAGRCSGTAASGGTTGGFKPNNPWQNDGFQGPTGGDRRLQWRERGVLKDPKEDQPGSWPSHASDKENPRWQPPTDEWKYDDRTQPVPGGTGPDNKPGVYATNPTPQGSRWFEQGSFKDPGFVDTTEPKWGSPDRSDNINVPEFKNALGSFERRRFGIPGMDKNYKRQYPMETVELADTRAPSPAEDHHPDFDYRSKTGKREGYENYNVPVHWDLKRAIHSLYRACLQGLPLVKQYYWVKPGLEEMARRVKEKFYMNRFVKDTDAIRNLIMLGWTDYQEIITFRKQKGGVVKFFSASDTMTAHGKEWAEEEGKMMEERRWWEGEEQKRDGPFDGFWSLAGKENYEEFQKLKGRVPMGWQAGKGYFEIWRCDGTNYWEKNMDYEGWFIKNVDPDRRAARKEIQNWVSAGYQQPKHYAAKNRRAYRRMVKDIDTMMNCSIQEMYASCRDVLFQYWIREGCPETNRLYAEKKLARSDDDFFTTKLDEMDRVRKQVMREMPNPRLWKTDAFYFRFTYLYAPFNELNWARAPVGVKQEKLFNEWISDTANYVVFNSPQHAEIKGCKKRNPMAKTWADFYREYDPERPETRRLPWYHAEFDYDRRHFWDERCMRMKKWVASGDIDCKNAFFEAQIAEWEQFINRPELSKEANHERKYAAPRMVQLYRALIRRNDVALANQMVQKLASQFGVAKVRSATESDVAAMLKSVNWSDFRFDVPVVVYPDGFQQPALNLDGTPAPAAPQTAGANAAQGEKPAPASATAAA